MYAPPELARNTLKPQMYHQFLANNIYPVQVTDPNIICNLNKEEFKFNLLDSTYEPDVSIRIARTPLSPTDPSTYAALSKFTEYYLRHFHSSTGAQSSNQLDKLPLAVPKELIASRADGKTEIFLFGHMLNPLISDPYTPVHLTPGCISSIITFTKDMKTTTNSNSNLTSLNKTLDTSFSNRLFGKSRHSKASVDLDNKQPKNNLNRNNSTFIERIITGDNYIKKMHHADSFLISAHGRVLNIIALDDNPKEIEVDPPCLRLILSSSIITCFSTFQYTTSTGEQNLDILCGFASGDILWLNPLRTKYSRWNKNGKIKKGLITSIEWDKSGEFAFVGFSDGEVIVFSRNLEDPELNYESSIQSKEKYMRIYKSVRTLTPSSTNPIAHYKFTKKPITSIKVNPIFNNIIAITSDDGFLRIFDLLSESITDIVPPFYAGLLITEFTPDGKFLLVGGEDDMVSIFEFQFTSIFNHACDPGLLKLVTRLQGAKSWIKGIFVDSSSINGASSLAYTIGTASDDGYIRFYEFQPRSLRKVKKHHHVASASYMTPPKFQMQKAFSGQSSDPNASLRKKRILNRSSNTLSSSTTTTNNQLSLFEIINRGPSSTSLQHLQSQSSTMQIKLGTANTLLASSPQLEAKKLDMMSKNILFRNKNISPSSILLCDVKPQNTYLHMNIVTDKIKNILPVSEKDVNLGRLSGVYIGGDSIWAFVASGDLVRWRRHEN